MADGYIESRMQEYEARRDAQQHRGVSRIKKQRIIRQIPRPDDEAL